MEIPIPNHHHLICRLCGQTVDVDCAVGVAPCLTPADASDYEIDEAEVIYWGRCPECLGQHRDQSGTEAESVPVPDVAQRNDHSESDRATAHDQTEQP